MAGLSTNAPGLWGGFAGLLYGSTSLSTPPGFLADATPAWVPAGGVLAFEFDNGLGYNSRNLATTTPDSILTYTAPSPKLIYGSDGVLRYAPHNLLLNTSWTAGAYVGDDWTPTGWTVFASGGTATVALGGAAALSSDSSIRFVTSAASETIGHSVTVATGERYRLSFDLEAMPVSVAWQQICLPSVVGVTIESYNGETTNGADTPIAVGSRVYMDFITTGAGALRIRLGLGTVSGVTGDITIARPMLTKLPMTGQTYIRNSSTSAAFYSLPIDHNPTTFEPLGVLIEEQRTNLLTYSEQLDNAAWTKSACSVTGNAAVAPDGTTTADLVTNTSVSGVHSITATIATVALVAHSASVYVKKGNNASVKVEAFGTAFSPTYAAIEYNFDTDTITPITGTATRALLSNGWVRITANFTASNTGCLVRLRAGPGNGADDATVYIWGAQLEAGAFPTSYIPTVASQVTRAADQVSILTSAFAYNAAAGTCAVETYNTYSFNFPEPWYLGDSAAITTKRIQTFLTGTTLTGRINDTTEQASVNAGSITLGAFNKFSMAWAVNDIGISLNAGAVATDTVATIPSTINQFGIGGRPSSGQINGHIKRLTYFPTRRSNADLQVLST